MKGVIFKIAWRNIWRHRARSFVVIGSVATGLWAGVFVMGFYFGMIEQRIQELVENEVSHIQMHHPQFKEDNNILYDIGDTEAILDAIRSDERVRHAAPRVIVTGMIGSARGSSGVIINGIDAEYEKLLTRLDSRVTQGEYLDTSKRNHILIGEALAEKLSIGERSRVVLTFQNEDGDITSGAFRVEGLFKSFSSQYDETQVFVRSEDLLQLLGSTISYHEIAILLQDKDQLDVVKSELQARHASLLVETWIELVPMMGYMLDMMDTFMIILIAVILIGVMFGIINTMLMAILERGRELGILLGVGMNKVRVFLMILLETLMLTMAGAPFGLLTGYFFILYFGNVGIDFSVFSEALASFGFTTVVYPQLAADKYIQITFMVFTLAIAASIFPAYRALQYNPAEAIRKV